MVVALLVQQGRGDDAHKVPPIIKDRATAHTAPDIRDKLKARKWQKQPIATFGINRRNLAG